MHSEKQYTKYNEFKIKEIGTKSDTPEIFDYDASDEYQPQVNRETDMFFL